MERKAHWYSVIQYSPDRIKGEKINVGLILHGPDDFFILFDMLDETNTKIRSLVYDDVSIRTFKVQREVIEYSLQNVLKNRSLTTPDIANNDFLKHCQSFMPTGFRLSEPTFSLTSNPGQLYEALLKKYIGESFLTSHGTAVQQLNVKKYVRDLFLEKQWIGTKIKPNVKLHPIKDIKNMQIQIDFVFKNGVWNLMQAVPASEDRLSEWFSKTTTILDSYQDEKSSYYILYDDKSELNADKTIEQMVRYLTRKDSRVKDVEIASNSFMELCHKVEVDAKDISLVEDELLAI